MVARHANPAAPAGGVTRWKEAASARLRCGRESRRWVGKVPERRKLGSVEHLCATEPAARRAERSARSPGSSWAEPVAGRVVERLVGRDDAVTSVLDGRAAFAWTDGGHAQAQREAQHDRPRGGIGPGLDGRLREQPGAGGSGLRPVPAPAGPADGAPADDRLADCAETTLMLVRLQEWVRQQQAVGM